ncbi:dolichyl-phosphate-mannose-protein mannosyltransferase [Chitinophaga niastensis]|uniref:Dolichyl-phosphate-mannose-protein mannosyltransferase n=1 Tax=Chitinophaga niastensis TaxID=536980 RepID=A0A2P8HPT8_CHINA|nr:hypothetical protein [Chitinophaga niastensis]PSL48216.1 dolichyl-phosphate-mannose-protein mannosyltransferase [Chitinophaga niastensis]
MPLIPSSFRQFILKEKRNRNYLLIAVLAAITQLIIFKLLYPYADFFSDSYSYIRAAASHYDVSIWPIGYSKFLWLFHQVTYSDTALVAFQYLFVEAMALYFFFTVCYFYQPTTQISNIIFIFLFFNPLTLYLSNYVSSDAPFLALSLWWVVQLLRIIHRPRPYQVITHALLVAVAFTFRYNAMYYPVITAIAFILSRHKVPYKIVGIVLPLLLIATFVNYTRNKAYDLTGTKQFSVFSGWQLANNALYMYPYIQVKEQPPVECREFHNMVNAYFDSIPSEFKTVSPRDGAFYIKYPTAPLKQYLEEHFNWEKDSTGGILAWGSVSPIYGSYGSFLIRHYPVAFARYFLLPNALNYCLPPLEKLEVYNTGSDNVSATASSWFHYPGTKVKVVSGTIQGAILLLCPAIFLVINLLFLGSLVVWIKTKWRKSNEPDFKYALLLMVALLVVNAAFSVMASPIVFRYQVFPMMICFSFLMLLIEKLEVLEK